MDIVIFPCNIPVFAMVVLCSAYTACVLNKCLNLSQDEKAFNLPYEN